jgi:hypothetical protein
MVLGLARWVLVLWLPTRFLALLGPQVRPLLPREDVRGVVAVALYLGLAVVFYRIGCGIFRHLYLSRRIYLGEKAAWVSRQRLFGRAWFLISREGEEGGREGKPGFSVAYKDMRRFFVVSLPTAEPPMVSLGLWYVGEDGRGREMWWFLDPEQAPEVRAFLEEKTGLQAMSPRPLSLPLASEEVS